MTEIPAASSPPRRPAQGPMRSAQPDSMFYLLLNRVDQDARDLRAVISAEFSGLRGDFREHTTEVRKLVHTMIAAVAIVSIMGMVTVGAVVGASVSGSIGAFTVQSGSSVALGAE